jgi:Prokaryotic RING finger family 2
MVGTAGSLLRAAGDLFGGVFGDAGNSAYEIQRAVGGKAHDSALQAAVAEVKPNFTQCVRCGKWVCNTVCWNEDRGLCSSCAPQTEEEIAAAQGQAVLSRVRREAGLSEVPAGHRQPETGGSPRIVGTGTGRQGPSCRGTYATQSTTGCGG